MLIVGILFIIATPIVLLVRASTSKRLLQMQSTETSTVAQLEETRAQMAGSFIQRAALAGTVECDQPLAAEFSGTACVAYRTKLEREYEETKWEKDADGHELERTFRGFETVSQNERATSFFLKDATGRIKVVPDGAQLVMERSLSDYRPAGVGAGFSLGSFVLDVASIGLGGRRTIGFRYEEWVVPMGHDLYALGEACESGGGLVFRRSSTKGERSILSVKSETELVGSAKTGQTVLLVVSIACAVVGLALVIVGLISR